MTDELKSTEESTEISNKSEPTSDQPPSPNSGESLLGPKITWPLRNITGAREGEEQQSLGVAPQIDDPTGPSLHPEKVAWPPRNVTGTCGDEDSEAAGAGSAIELPALSAAEQSDPPKRWAEPRNVTGTNEGRGLQMLGWDVPGRKPPPMPEESELRKVAESPHPYPDLPQVPARDRFDDIAAFNMAISHWLVNVAPVVLRRNKYGRPRPKSVRD